MSTALSPDERDRLIAICGMLGSAFDGERASAALLATRLLKEKGLGWCDEDDPIGQDWRRLAVECARFRHLLNQWESDSPADVPRFPRLSEKQHASLLKVVVRLKACGCAI
jgi:hypothetical protein